MKKAVLLTSLMTIVFALSGFFLTEPVFAAPDDFYLDFGNALLVLSPANEQTKVPNIQVSAENFIITYGSDWEIKQLTPDLFHLRNKKWPAFYWKIDNNLKRAYKMTNGTFGSSEEKGGDLIDSINIDDNNKFKNIFLRFSSFYLEHAGGKSRIVADGALIVDSDSLELKQIEPNLWHIRHKMWAQLPKKFYWKVNTISKEVHKVFDGQFGFPGGTETLTGAIVRDGNKSQISKKKGSKIENAISEKLPGVLEDFGFSNIKESQRPKSDWLESQKTLYKNLLKGPDYDVLIIPFQVQGYAIDRVSRSLMTRYLSYRIEKTTGLKISDPTLVARALGENARTLDDEEIFKLANDLRVKTLIRGYVGHNRDEKLFLTLLVQVRHGADPFDAKTSITKLEWRDIPFSDENLPEEAFKGLLDNIMMKTSFSENKKIELIAYEKEKQLAVPKTIKEVISTKTVNPILSSYYLQLFGMLYPEDSTNHFPDDFTAREHFFERSLVALNTVAPTSPDYALLKARALFYLHRRPAALSVLGNPGTPEGKAFLALLNGNLPELKKWTSEIKSLLPKLLAQIELNDLQLFYENNKQIDEDSVKKIAGEFGDWEMIITRRMLGKDIWFSQSNYEIKQRLDEHFPIPDFTAENIFKSRLVLGKSDFGSEDLDFSIYNHYKKVLNSSMGKPNFLDDSSHPSEMDYLYLLYGIGDTNMFKNIRHLILTQGLYEEGLEILNRYEMQFGGHLKMAYLKVLALRALERAKQGELRENIEKLKKAEEAKICYLSQGQTPLAQNCCPMEKFYDGDYPKRSFLISLARPMDRKELSKNNPFRVDTSFLDNNQTNYLNNLAVSLLYSHNEINSLKIYYKELVKLKKNETADMLLELNKNRFVGNPQYASFLAQKTLTADPNKTITLYEKAISETPEAWEPYSKLGELYIGRGEFKKALETFQRYPPFKKGARSNRVAASNDAYMAASGLFLRGAIEESIPLFQIASDSNTGSGAEMNSSEILASLEGDFTKAAFHALQHIKRYAQGHDFMSYMTYLYILGYNKEAWAVFNSINVQAFSPVIWRAVFIGHRMEAKTSEEIIQWLSNSNLQEVTANHIGRYILLTNLFDRTPTQNIANIIDKESKNFKKASADDYELKDLIWFSKGYYYTKVKDSIQAFNVLKEKKDYYFNRRVYKEAFPYFVFNGIKSNNLNLIEDSFKNLEDEHGDTFEFHLAKAYYHGLQNDHQKALSHLKLASYRIPLFFTLRLIYPWYQLVETCEWLYEETRYEEYRKLAIEWAKMHQRIQPWFAWAYAVEAKYTDSASDRLRALAITLYLDKQSERISKFSEKEKAEALEWLKKNNPFLSNTSKPLKTTL